MKGLHVILGVVLCLSLLEIRLARSNKVAKRETTPANELKLAAMAKKRERMAEGESGGALKAEDSSRFPVPLMFKTTALQQEAIANEGGSKLALANDPTVTFYIGDTFVIILGEYFTITEGKITYKSFVYVVCGLTLALDSEFLCCKKALVDKSIGPVACCYDIYYNTETEVCCGDYFYPKTVEGSSVGCCDKAAYLVGTESCCSKAIIQQPTCPSTCQAGADQFCCEGLVYPISIFFKCCVGKGIYVTFFQVCCNSKIVLGTTCPPVGR